MKTFMMSLTTARRTITIALGIVSLGLLGSSAWTSPLIQSRNRSIIRRTSYYKYPVEISFHLKGHPLTNEKLIDGFRSNDFDADGDWLNDLTIKIKNTSGKTITWMLVNLLFPEITKDGPIALHQVFLGVDPDAPFSRPELRLLPNQTLEIPLNARYDDIKRLVNVIGYGTPIESVSKVEVEFQAALFDDETRFETGETYRRNSDPSNPQKWIRINEIPSPDYPFPGYPEEFSPMRTWRPGKPRLTEPTSKFLKAMNPVTNRYIVKLKDDVVPKNNSIESKRDRISEIASAHASAYRGQVEYIYAAVLGGYSIELPNEAAARALSDNPQVQWVSEVEQGKWAKDEGAGDGYNFDGNSFEPPKPHGAGGQARQKIIEKARTENEVVQFSEIKVSQKPVEPGKTLVDDDDDWAGKIFLKVKNISDKPIVYLAVNINFPETRATGAMMSYPIVLGQMPGSKFRQFHDPISLLPGEGLEIPVTQNHAKMKSFVENGGMPFRNISKVKLEIGFVIFADKTAWSAGVFKRQNPNNPDRYDPIN